jgi:hypothetical protein
MIKNFVFNGKYSASLCAKINLKIYIKKFDVILHEEFDK